MDPRYLRIQRLEAKVEALREMLVKLVNHLDEANPEYGFLTDLSIRLEDLR